MNTLACCRRTPRRDGAGLLVSRVICRDAYFPGRLILHGDIRVNFIFLVAVQQLQIDLLGRVFIGKLETSGYGIEIGSLPLAQCRQAPANILLIKITVPLDIDFPDAVLIDFQANDPLSSSCSGSVTMTMEKPRLR